MNLEEAREVMNISDAERKSIRDYRTGQHTRINFLANMTIEHLANYPGGIGAFASNPQISEQTIDDFVNIHSATYKYSKTHSLSDITRKTPLYRGVDSYILSQWRQGEPIRQALSTSVGTNGIKVYNPNTLIMAQITPESNVPFIVGNEFDDESEKAEDGETTKTTEVILSPFCRPKENPQPVEQTHQFDNFRRMGYMGNAYSTYGVTLERPDLQEVSDEKLDELRTEIVQGFRQNLFDLKELSDVARTKTTTDFRGIVNDISSQSFNIPSLSRFCDLVRQGKITKISELAQWKLEKIRAEQKRLLNEIKDMPDGPEKDRKISTARDKFDFTIESIIKEVEERDRIIIEKTGTTSSFRDKISQLLQGLCRKREKEIDQAEHVVLLDKCTEGRANVQKTALDLERTLTTNIKGLMNIESEYRTKYDSWGLRYGGTAVNVPKIKSGVYEILHNLSRIGTQMETTTLDENTSIDDMKKVAKNVEEISLGLSAGTREFQDFPEIVDSYKVQSELELKKGLYDRVQEAIRQEKIAKYTAEKEKEKSKKIGFFGFLFGKDKIQEEKIRQLDLKVELVKMPKVPENGVYDEKDMLAELMATSISEFDGNMEKSPKVKQVYDLIKSKVKDREDCSDESVRELAEQKIAINGENLPAVQDPNKLPFWGRNRCELQALQANNNYLTQKVQVSQMNKMHSSREAIIQNAIAVLERKIAEVNEATRVNRMQTVEQTNDKDSVANDNLSNSVDLII